MSEFAAILKTVESLRKQLNELHNKKGSIDADVLALSQMLDGVLNEYQRLLKERNEKL